jgi:hypothetical protein|nr:MAG TPA: hypothetical protein [Caudoviricetes sp.]
MNTVRRKTINDSLITQDIIDKLVIYTYEHLEDIYEFSQSDIVKTLISKTTKLSSVTIARVIRAMLPESGATANSVNVIINRLKKRSNEIDELLNELNLEG